MKKAYRDLMEFNSDGKIKEASEGDIHVKADLDIDIMDKVSGSIFAARNTHIVISDDFSGTIYADVGSLIEIKCPHCDAIVYLNQAKLLINEKSVLHGTVYCDQGRFINEGIHDGVVEEMSANEQILEG